MALTFVPIIIFAIAFLMILVAVNSFKKTRVATKRYRGAKSYQTSARRYIAGQFSPQMELDMRLPYKRFKQLYPENKWTYKEYKMMQMQTAFRRSYSSQDNKRMVR
jgi:hypothetical protein